MKFSIYLNRRVFVMLYSFGASGEGGGGVSWGRAVLPDCGISWLSSLTVLHVPVSAYQSTSGKRSTRKGKNSLSLGVKSFLSEQTQYSEVDRNNFDCVVSLKVYLLISFGCSNALLLTALSFLCKKSLVNWYIRVLI